VFQEGERGQGDLDIAWGEGVERIELVPMAIGGREEQSILSGLPS